VWNINISIYLNIRAAYLDIWIYELEKKNGSVGSANTSQY